jgi:hypothetical protein
MSEIVPGKWITTFEALRALGSDGRAKADDLIAAAKDRSPEAIALVREGKEWTEYPLPLDYWETGAADTALWTGEVDSLGLTHKRLDGKPLCFRRAELKAWLAEEPPKNPTATKESKLRAEIRKRYAALYPNGHGVESWKEVARKCNDGLKRARPISERAIRRALGHK